MPRTRVYYYDPHVLTGGADDSRGDDSDNVASVSPRSLLHRARAGLQAQRSAPLNEYEALMQCAPGDEPRDTAVDRDAALEPLTAALATLTERERWIIEALFWRRLPLRAVERELSLSKTQVARIRDVAIGKLRDELSTSPDAIGALFS